MNSLREKYDGSPEGILSPAGFIILHYWEKDKKIKRVDTKHEKWYNIVATQIHTSHGKGANAFTGILYHHVKKKSRSGMEI